MSAFAKAGEYIFKHGPQSGILSTFRGPAECAEWLRECFKRDGKYLSGHFYSIPMKIEGDYFVISTTDNSEFKIRYQLSEDEMRMVMQWRLEAQ